MQTTHPLLYDKHTCTCHIIKLSILQKYATLQSMREEASFRMFFEKVRMSKRKLEVNDPKLPKNEKFRVIMRKPKLL